MATISAWLESDLSTVKTCQVRVLPAANPFSVLDYHRTVGTTPITPTSDSTAGACTQNNWNLKVVCGAGQKVGKWDFNWSLLDPYGQNYRKVTIYFSGFNPSPAWKEGLHSARIVVGYMDRNY